MIYRKTGIKFWCWVVGTLICECVDVYCGVNVTESMTSVYKFIREKEKDGKNIESNYVNVRNQGT